MTEKELQLLGFEKQEDGGIELSDDESGVWVEDEFHYYTYTIAQGFQFISNSNDEVGEDGQWYVRTIGDNVAAIQDTVPIPLENIQGVVVGSSPIISKLANFLSKWYGFVVLIVIPLLCVLAWQIIVLARQGAKERMEEIKKNQVLMIERQVQQDLEEEIKRKAVEEYIKQQETKENNGSNT